MALRKNILISIGVVIGTLGLIYLFNNKGKKKNWIMGNKKTTIKSMIFSIPETKSESYNLLVIFGGLSYANPEWMYKQIPENILSQNFIVIAPYNLNYLAIKNDIDSFAKDNNFSISSKSIFGFSAGGLQVEKALSAENWKVVGLIDPSIKPEYASLPYGKNVYLLMNIYNWAGTYKSFDYKKAYSQMKDSIIRGGGYVEDRKMVHADFPKTFFKQFENKINA